MDEKDVIEELIRACMMSLNWINNLVNDQGQDVVIDAMPNNCRGRLQLHEAIDRGLKALEE